ncbi:hypothetical protein FZEAL_476, partial [Fusarium zealandicum]
ATLGKYAFGFAWASWAALFVATVLFCLGLRGDKSTGSGSGGYSSRSWRRNRSVRSSHNGYEGRRVKDDYSNVSTAQLHERHEGEAQGEDYLEIRPPAVTVNQISNNTDVGESTHPKDGTNRPAVTTMSPGSGNTH